MNCMIKEFANLSRVNDWKLTILEELNGYRVVYQKDEKTEPICLVTQKNDVRYWKSVDVLIKHLTEAGFSGYIEIHISKQLSI